MAHLNLDLNYFNHPKTSRLIGLLGRGAEVLPIRLWCYCGLYHWSDGKLTGHSGREIEAVVGWWGKPETMMEAMRKVKFMDLDAEGNWSMHGWDEMQGHIKRAKEKSKEMHNARYGGGEAATSSAGSSAAEPPQQSQCSAVQYSTESLPHTTRGVVRPSVEEVKTEAQRIGLVEWKAVHWWDQMEAVCWVDAKGHVIADWRAMLRVVKTWWEADGRPMTPEKQYEQRNSTRKSSSRPDRNAGTANADSASEFRGLGQVPKAGDLPRS